MSRASATARPRAAPAPEQLLSGWGMVAPTRARMVRPESADQVSELVAQAGARGLIARGAGRSYGDAAQNAGGTVLDATALRGPIALDPARGLVQVSAGTMCGELMLALAPEGFTLPVVPGTRHLTVGGAIASDVHGKNHPRDGSFGRHVEFLTLCTPADGPVLASRQLRADLFSATIGGMGLTGVVLDAALRVVPLRSARALADIDRRPSIEGALALMAEPSSHRYAIAWLDLLRGGRAFGRSVITRSDEAPAASNGAWSGGGSRPAKAPFSLKPLVGVPRRAPGGLLRPAMVHAFNAFHWHSERRRRGAEMTMSEQLFPLDVLGNWNRLYRPAGLLQYQFVVPRGKEDVLLTVIERLRARRIPMYLAVIKRFGPGTGGPLSFPLEGFTAAIDIPAGAPELARSLDQADELVADAGGRVYLAKDARLRADILAAMYPELERFRELRARVDPDATLRSDMARRLGLCE
jgi:decaprenylphospho-beta-D-ribofuranose 2-oxidase